jgi:hypothetical protein
MPKFKVDFIVQNFPDPDESAYLAVREAVRNQLKHTKVKTRQWNRGTITIVYTEFCDDAVIGYEDWKEKYFESLIEEVKEKGVVIQSVDITAASQIYISQP